MPERLTPPAELLCVGETMVLVAPVGAPLAAAGEASLGLAGAESNVAAQVAAHGRRAAWMSRVGTDALGERIVDELTARGVDVRVEWDPAAPTGVMFKDPSAFSERGSESSAVYYYRRGSAAARMDAGFVRPADIAGARIVHTSGITPALSSSCARMVERLFDDARAAGAAVSFDVNDRRALWSLDEAAGTLARYADAADLCLVGRDEAERLWGTATADDIRDRLPGPSLLVVKDGAVGATAYPRGADPVCVAAPRVEVVEPVGAGDAFAAGFLAATLDDAPLAARLSAGHAAAARALSTHHDLPPREATR